MTQEQSYNFSKINVSEEEELKRLRAQVFLLWEKEQRYLKTLDLDSNIRILDAGCGPGYISEKFLHMFPESRITALDSDPNILSNARKFLSNYSDRIEFHESSIYETSFEDNTFDFVYARLIFQHLNDPIKALKEIHRILKPGGIIAIMDADDAGQLILSPEYTRLQDVITLFGEMQAARGGDRFVARKLVRFLKSTGFSDIEFDSITMHSDLDKREDLLTVFSPNSMTMAFQNGLIPEDLYKDHMEYYNNNINNPDLIVVYSGFMTIGKK